MRSLRMGVAMGCLVVTALACTGSGDGGSGGGTGTGGSATSGGGGGSAGGSGGGGADNPNQGGISVEKTCADVMGTMACNFSSGTFFAKGVAPPERSCVSSTSGSCNVLDCLYADDGGAPPDSTQVSAGTISVAGTLVDGGVMMTFSADGGYFDGYSAVFTSYSPWRGGETLTVSATGATVPAFTDKTVTAPADLIVTTPACPQGDCGAIDGTAAFHLTWTGARAAHVSLISTDLAVFRSVFITCDFASSPASIPADVMTKVGKTADGYDNSLNVETLTTTGFNAGEYAVTFSAVTWGLVANLNIQ